MRAACYCRVSTRDQSSQMQLDETNALIARRGWTPARSFVDDGASGASQARRGLRELLAAARRREFDVLVVYRTDRVFRSLQSLLSTLAELEERGIAFVSVHEPFDTTTSAGRLLFQIVGAFAEFERNVLRERTRSGMELARRKGKRIGRPPRSVDPELVVRLRANGAAWDDIARELEVPVRTLQRAARSAPKGCLEAPAEVGETA